MYCCALLFKLIRGWVGMDGLDGLGGGVALL